MPHIIDIKPDPISIDPVAVDAFSLEDNTFTAAEQSFASVEVGDSKQPDDFYPQVKIMRWDNEVNFSVRLVTGAPPVAVSTPDDVAAIQATTATRIAGNLKPGGIIVKQPPVDPTPAVALVDDKVQWVTPAVEAHFYQVGDGLEGDSFEFEIVLNEQPSTNVISMTLQTKGLDFFYQSPLTLEEIKRGASRPENVVGSYAVYHKTMAGDFSALGGKNYLAGKAFHIFRPRIEDATGNWVWGELNIDEKAGLLTVTIPQDFLDKAVYPVRHAAGLEFGYHTVGGTEEASYSTVPSLCRFLFNGSGGTLASIVLYCKNYPGYTTSHRPAFYADNAGVVGDRLAKVDSGGTNLGTDYAWVETPLIYPGLVTSYYWVGKATGNYGIVKYDAGGIGQAQAGNLTTPWPNPVTGCYYGNDVIYSQFATYAPAATGQATAKRFGGVPYVGLNKGVW